MSLEQSSVCVVDAAGKIIREAKVASEPEDLIRFFRELGMQVIRIGLEAGPLSQWLHAGLAAAGFEVVLLETRHVKAALSAMVVKTDRKDARGIAQLLRMGWFRPVHAKSPAAHSGAESRRGRTRCSWADHSPQSSSVQLAPGARSEPWRERCSSTWRSRLLLTGPSGTSKPGGCPAPQPLESRKL